MDDQLIKKEFEQLKAGEATAIPAFDTLYQAAQQQARLRKYRRRSWQLAATVLVLVLAGTFWWPERGGALEVEVGAGNALSEWSAPTDQSLKEANRSTLSNWQSPTQFLMPAAN